MARLAPVTPLFGERGNGGERGALAAKSTNAAAAAVEESTHAGAPAAAAENTTDAAAAQAAEAVLLKKLRLRSLSVAEARAVLVEHRLPDEQIESVLHTFQQRGYLDDRALAEQLVHTGVDRKGQGRRAIAQALTARGIPRTEAEQVLAELPDDDAERALDYALRKVRSVGGSGREAALRRLVGQLQRRGYSSSVAMTAARAALDGES